MVRSGLRVFIALLLPAALAACGQGNDADRNLDSLDAELADGNSAGNSRDPALMSALHDQIMVDPALAGQANADAIRPPSQPYAAPVPPESAGKALTGPAQDNMPTKTAPAAKGACPQCAAKQESMTLGALAARQASGRTRACAANVQYSTRWALRLPADLPLYPDARVTEAAGNEGGNCALRIVSFASGAPLQTVIDWYYTRATNAGYSGEHEADGDEHVLAGTRGDAAYAVFLNARGDGGTDVDLVVNTGK
ncbi:MAG: hypothetical protein B7Y45_01955 [Sphingomonas sp. 28-66-16]|nr:MAG: hypothetical protein B7Y45_01955 [Sphingomonas sp. 28-66-16]